MDTSEFCLWTQLWGGSLVELVSMIHSLFFFLSLFFIRGREKERGWIMGTSELVLRTDLSINNCCNKNVTPEKSHSMVWMTSLGWITELSISGFSIKTYFWGSFEKLRLGFELLMFYYVKPRSAKKVQI